MGHDQGLISTGIEILYVNVARGTTELLFQPHSLGMESGGPQIHKKKIELGVPTTSRFFFMYVCEMFTC